MATIAILTAPSAQFPSANFPELKTIHTTERRFILSFDAATEESCTWDLVAPQSLTGALTAVVFYSMASATTGGVRVGVSVEAVTPTDALDLDAATGYDTENAASDTGVPGTAGHMESISVTLTNADGVAAGDLVRIKLARKVAHADDTASGDLQIHAVDLRDAA